MHGLLAGLADSLEGGLAGEQCDLQGKFS
jgi:hypothetical protein